MSQQSSVEGLFRSLIDFNRAVRAQGARWTEAGARVSRNELIVLGMLVDAEVTRASQVSERMSVGPSVVSRLVGSLSERGLIERTTDPDDGRAERLSVTEAGQVELKRARAAYIAALAERLEGWSAGDIDRTAAALDELREALVKDV